MMTAGPQGGCGGVQHIYYAFKTLTMAVRCIRETLKTVSAKECL